ncbi:MAG: hypothetical protein A2945_02480 [Candidatus Liptonbacteria bacterium RIFCSPLOWO2_01_FULL_52_25]|uniref:Uncharacterized protein n=1 Tax=Candidatus Liptonbacteria bacterium RIFCSPLOWO2_01_FULL_52_25 TaxID=1798650 RepID=A0A1G2CF29_9BACT|nr:MAG: hypothetical protein A2945_02480 [Candidatus Liptonbacteria bacterium RIFCSPLOWO2_01_FULL_52_25]
MSRVDVEIGGPADDFTKKTREEIALAYHYYGDRVRKLFLLGALIMVAGLPFLYDVIPLPVPFSILAIFILLAAAGLTNPQQVLTSAVNVALAVLATGAFEYYAVYASQNFGVWSLFFWANEALAVNFLFASYYGIKTLRGALVLENGKGEKK